ncbi:MAG: hypothetical protein WAT93_04440 [Pontixanthobacter sp.]
MLANEGLSSRGVMLFGSGFIVKKFQLMDLGLETRADANQLLRPYLNGRDLLQRPRGAWVIDAFGKTESELRQGFPEIYEHLLRTVKPQRDKNRDKTISKNWWLFGRPRSEIRPALENQRRYIATVETAKHRVFEFLDQRILPDNKILLIACSDSLSLGICQSIIHLQWTYANCGLIGMASFEKGHVYVKSKCFDPFPFPDATETQRAAIADIAEELDETRKLAIAETDKLTMTELYNLREKLRSGEPLSDKDQRRATAARAGIVNRLHEQLDQAVADAYGWGAEWAAGSLGPSEIVARLVALNHERAEEEKQGKIRWLRPDYQIPRFAPDRK